MKQKPSAPKTLAWIYTAVAVFTGVSIIVPILWERFAQKEDRQK